VNKILESDIKYLQGVGPKRAALLEKELGISTFRDMLYTFPFRYIDRTGFYSIREIESCSAHIQLRGSITDLRLIGEGRAKRLIAHLSDGTGTIELVFFQGIKWISKSLKIGTEYIVFGKPSIFNQTYNMVHPEMDLATEDKLAMVGTLIGVYSSTERLRSAGIGNKVFAKLQYNLISQVIENIEETLPRNMLLRKRFISLRQALVNIHFPTDLQILDKAKERLKFEELFYLQLSLLKQKNIRMRSTTGILFNNIGEAFNTTYKLLPFPLTEAQKRVIKEIRSDVVSGSQMNRLLQGDVGSGKTLVALFSALMAVDNGYQACIMAPTEVLASQHYRGTLRFLEHSGVKTALLTGTTKAKERRAIHEGLEDGSINIIFGTHALIEENVQFLNLGLAVIDEQHRFGVEQRSRLWTKSTMPPHILVMTATPIPRTLAMTFWGDLDVSVIDELPPGRKPVQTIHWGESSRPRLHEFMKREIKSGRQVFVVYPLIKESEKMDYKNLEEGYEAIVKAFPPPEYRTAVVHGQQRPENKAFDMELFVSGKANILVSTSVIEVGVDVPNASVMVIESAERFGLSQLHQLRGRVGRGAEKSYCVLMTGYKLSNESLQRIEMMCRTTDGFELAEADLRMRGPGDFEGTRQSGLALNLRIANLGRDSAVLEDARREASDILEKDPLLSSRENDFLTKVLRDLRIEIKDYSNIS